MPINTDRSETSEKRQLIIYTLIFPTNTINEIILYSTHPIPTYQSHDRPIVTRLYDMKKKQKEFTLGRFTRVRAPKNKVFALPRADVSHFPMRTRNAFYPKLNFISFSKAKLDPFRHETAERATTSLKRRRLLKPTYPHDFRSDRGRYRSSTTYWNRSDEPNCDRAKPTFIEW